MNLRRILADPFRDPGPPAGGPQPEIKVGNTLIMLRNTYGRCQRWTDLSVQEVALRIRNSEVIPLTEGDWLSPWNVDTFISREKLGSLPETQ